jgi:O-antigen ligase
MKTDLYSCPKVAARSALNRAFYISIVILMTLPPVFAVFVDLFSPPFGGYADQRFILCGTLIGLLVLGCTIGCRNSGIWVRMLGAWPLAGCSLLFVFLSLPYAGQDFVWVEPGLYAFFYLAVALVGAVLADGEKAEKVASFFLIAISVLCFFYGAMTVTVYIFAISDGVQKLTDYIPWGFVNIRYWSHVATWLLPLLPVAVISSPLKKYPLWRFLVAIGAGLWWWVVILSMARGTIIALVLSVICVLILFGRMAWPWLRKFSLQVFFGVVFWFVFSVLFPAFLIDASGISLRDLSLDSSGRFPLFVEAWRMSIENFPFGMGPQSWLTHEILTEGYRNSHRFGHPHNMYLMWASEYGWLLLLFFAGVILQAFKRLLDKRKVIVASDIQYSSIVVAFTVSVLAAFAHAFVSAVFIAPASMLVGLPILIIFWALYEPSYLRRPVISTSRNIYFFVQSISAVVLLVMILAASLWLNEVAVYYQSMRADEAFYQENVPGGLAPRFWFHGNFPRSPELMPPD